MGESKEIVLYVKHQMDKALTALACRPLEDVARERAGHRVTKTFAFRVLDELRMVLDKVCGAHQVMYPKVKPADPTKNYDDAIDQLEGVVDGVIKMVEQAKKIVKKNKQVTEENEQLKKTNNQLFKESEERYSELQSDLQQMKTERNTWERDYTKSHSEKLELQDKLEVAETELDKVKKEYQRLKDLQSRGGMNINAQLASIGAEDMQKKYKQLQEEMNTLKGVKADFDYAQKHIKDLEEAAELNKQKADQEIARLKHCLETYVKEQEQCMRVAEFDEEQDEDRKRKMPKQLSDALQRLEEAYKREERRREEMKETQRNIELLTRQIEDLKRTIENKDVLIASKTSALELLEQNCKQITELKETFRGSSTTFQQKAEGYEQDLKELRKELKQAAAEVAQLTNEKFHLTLLNQTQQANLTSISYMGTPSRQGDGDGPPVDTSTPRRQEDQEPLSHATKKQAISVASSGAPSDAQPDTR